MTVHVLTCEKAALDRNGFSASYNGVMRLHALDAGKQNRLGKVGTYLR
jgi:hypothetical protein